MAAIVRSRPGAVEVDVTLSTGHHVTAIAYPPLTGAIEPGTAVLLNTAAVDLGLGTGGFALVVATPDHLPPDPTGSGQVVKARYTPLQATVQSADEQGSPWHERLRDADSIGGMPVVVADLHSALPAIVAGIHAADPAQRIAYVMTDGGALPAAFSRTIAALRETGGLVGCVTAGQAYGGDVEAVSVHSALLAARLVLAADVAVVIQGPGNLGTDTRWGFSGVAAGDAVNAVGVLGGRPVAALRVSAADPRERHRGVSHHSLTAYGRVAVTAADVVVPALPGDFGERVRRAAAPLAARHRLIDVSVDGLDAVLRASPVDLSSMGRSYGDDPAAFLSAAAAGRHAAGLVGTAT